MTKNAKTVAIVAIAAAVVLTLVFAMRDVLLRQQRTVACPEGSHPSIDIRDFTTQYWSYSGKLEASIADKGKVSVEVDPKALERVSQALQEAREFRKYVVAGYDSCAITQVQYARFGAQFHALEGLAQEINTLLSQPSLSQPEKTKLAALITQYGDIVRELGSQ